MLNLSVFAAEITLVRFGPIGEEKPGIIDAQNQIRDLSSVIADITPQQLSDEVINRIAQTPIESLPIVSDNPRIGTPLTGVGKIIAIGFNYVNNHKY